MKITFCIPSKNNLRYLKSCIQSIKSNSAYKNNIVVYVDSDSDGTELWLRENNIRFLKNTSGSPKGIAYAYNRCIEEATTDIVCMFHADMYMAKGFDIALIKHLKPKTVVSGTRIEPPLHPAGLEKIVMDFGMYPEDFKQIEFDTYVDNLIKENLDLTTRGIFAPWACYKKDILEINSHDTYFHSYHEDSDMFNRFILSGYTIVQTWEGFVYHLTCRGGQYQDGIEKITTDPAFHRMKNVSMKHYLRKWGSWIKNDQYQHPIIHHKYDIGFIARNCNQQLLELLEPWCTTIYVDCDIDTYIKKERDNTSYDLRTRVYNLDKVYHYNHILVEFDCKRFTQQSFEIIQSLPAIIEESGSKGTFELDIFTITIKDLSYTEQNLIICNTTS